MTSSLKSGRERVVVLAVRPSIDGGRYPAKRVVGERLSIEVDLVVDGHDIVRAIALYRYESDTSWNEVPLVHRGNDRWEATIPMTRLGRCFYTALAWVDTFATWRHGLERKAAAKADVSIELIEGAILLEQAAGRAPRESVLLTAARALRGSGSLAEKLATATSPEVALVMARASDRSLASRYRHELEVNVEQGLAGYSAWYELFPRSTGPDGRHGTLRDAERLLPYIAELGFDIVYLPPIHPIGRAFRKGPDNTPQAGEHDVGSPWAIGDRDGGHTAVHPALGTLADFDHFVAAARSRGLEVALDIAFQASPDHPWVTEHPSWFRSRPDGTIQYAENPPKKYQDVYPFDFESVDWEALWDALRDVFLFWADRGVRCFRVDNPHTKPIGFWEWCIRKVQRRYPDTVFLAEAFTRPQLTYALAKSGFSQSYTYFTWRTTKAELAAYVQELVTTNVVEFFRPNFWPTTPDIFPEYLAHGGRPAFIARLVLAATLSSSYGIYGPSYELMERMPRPGSEELARNEKYQLRSWNLDDPDSLRHVITRINEIRRANPALHSNRSLRIHRTDNDLVLCYSKRTIDRDNIVVVVVNLDPHHTHATWLELDLDELGLEPDQSFQAHDLLGGTHYLWRGSRNYVELEPDVMPAHVFEIRRLVRTENQFEYFL